MKTKFYTCQTPEGAKTINISNIALIEKVHGETIITLNVKKNHETNVSFKVIGHTDSLVFDIESLSNQ
jgi:aspartyl aminopeptidase